MDLDLFRLLEEEEEEEEEGVSESPGDIMGATGARRVG